MLYAIAGIAWDALLAASLLAIALMAGYALVAGSKYDERLDPGARLLALVIMLVCGYTGTDWLASLAGQVASLLAGVGPA